MRTRSDPKRNAISIIFLIVLSGLIIFISYSYLRRSQTNISSEKNIRKNDKDIKSMSSLKPTESRRKRNFEKQRQNKPLKKVAISQDDLKIERKSAKDLNRLIKKRTKDLQKSPSSRKIMMPDTEDMFHYDPEDDVYVVDAINYLPVEPFDSYDFFRLLKILNKSHRNPEKKSGNNIKIILTESEYQEYDDAYNKMDRWYPDVHLWAFLSANQAKKIFFAYLLQKYAEDNDKWHNYEKDIADCSQFSQRTYFFMYPGEIVIEDHDYFDFLFQNDNHLIERKKNINKVPTMAYALVERFYFQNLVEHIDEEESRGHAMVAFKTTSGIGSWFIGEPQNGNFTDLHYLDSIIPAARDEKEFGHVKKSNILTLGKISIPKSEKGEASIVKQYLKCFIGKGTPNRVEILTNESYAILLMFKRLVETRNNDDKILKDYFKLIDDVLKNNQETGLDQLLEKTSTAMDIFLSEMERVTNEGNIWNIAKEKIMEFSDGLEDEAGKFSFSEDEDETYINNLSNFIDHFRAMVLAKLDQ